MPDSMITLPLANTVSGSIWDKNCFRAVLRIGGGLLLVVDVVDVDVDDTAKYA